MKRYSVQPKDRTFAKGYGFLSFVKNMDKNIGKNININISGKCSRNFIGHAKHCATDVFKTVLKRAIQRTAETIRGLIGNKIADKITKVPKNSQQNISKKVTIENDKEIPTKIPRERYISPKERQEIIDKLDNGISESNKFFRLFTKSTN